MVDKQLTKSFKIKDQFILSQLDFTISGYRKAISELGSKLKSFSAESLKQYLLQKEIKVDFCNFVANTLLNLRIKKKQPKQLQTFKLSEII